MRCEGCVKPVAFEECGVKFCKGCDYSPASLYAPPARGSRPVVKGEMTPDEAQHHLAIESMKFLAMRQYCMTIMGLPVVISKGYKVITHPRDYAVSFLKYADERGITIPNRENFERMAKS